MMFKELQENLRRALLSRVRAGEFTGVALASRLGFQQAHISNFLNGKRNLSLEAMDQVLKTLNLSVLDLLDTKTAPRTNGPLAPPHEKNYDSVPLVSFESAATELLIARSRTLDELHFKRSFLRRLRPNLVGDRSGWTRFVLIKADARNAAAMYPRLTAGATLLIDRHYNSLKTYRRAEQNIYAVRKAGSCVIRYAALHGNQLSLRPQSDNAPLDFVPVAPGRSFADYIVGRVCHVGLEL